MSDKTWGMILRADPNWTLGYPAQDAVDWVPKKEADARIATLEAADEAAQEEIRHLRSCLSQAEKDKAALEAAQAEKP